MRIAGLVAAAAILAGTSTVASGAPLAPTDRDRDVVIAANGIRQGDGRVFYPTGEIDPDTLVIIPDEDGVLPGGLSVAKGRQILEAEGGDGLAAAIAEADAERVSPMAASNTFITGFRPEWSEFRHFSGLIGTNDSVVANYRFAPQVGTQQWVCAKGLGYYKGYNGSEFGVWSNWYDLGCKKAGGVLWKITAVPWGNVAAVPTARFQSQHYHMIANGEWGF
ncbi:hypothetical protein [Cellulomonas iranensis]|uniref:Uncharacterized protein n=1 Tax=Cellulomonas iranensis TaxID=76862 RepID=A0ABU0GJJ2_9CELL|nr:hypothetical protein [Cellulomonas iranensis]MDQ0425535.1 hypothetical protein [Cellulomonas iranensis]